MQHLEPEAEDNRTLFGWNYYPDPHKSKLRSDQLRLLPHADTDVITLLFQKPGSGNACMLPLDMTCCCLSVCFLVPASYKQSYMCTTRAHDCSWLYSRQAQQAWTRHKGTTVALAPTVRHMTCWSLPRSYLITWHKEVSMDQWSLLYDLPCIIQILPQ